MRTAIWGILAEDVRAEGDPRRIIRRCKDAGIETYFAHANPISIADHPGDSDIVWYNTKVLQGRVEDALMPLAEEGRREGVGVEPWFLPFDISPSIGENSEDTARRAYRSGLPGGHKSDGKALCASWPENRDRAIERLNDLIEGHGAGITGIHADWIRYTNAEVSLEYPCQCEACSAAYSRLFGKETLTGEDLDVPGVLYKLIQFRAENVREVVERSREITNRAGLRLTLAARADYFAWALPEGQDWARWAADGLVDLVCPMNYFVDRPTHLKNVTTNDALLKSQPSVSHFDGLGKMSSFGTLNTEDLVTWAKDARAAGADGVSIFKYSGMDDSDFDALRRLAAE